MKIYSIFKQEKKEVQVMQSVCYNNLYAFFFSFIWLITKTNWKVIMLVGIFTCILVLFHQIYPQFSIIFVFFIAHISIGFLSGHLLELSYLLDGYKLADIIYARNADEALLLFMQKNS